MTARSCQGENDSVVSFQSDRRKTRCSGHKSSVAFDRPHAAAQNKIRAARHSICKIADKAGTRCARRAGSSTSARDDQIVSALRPLFMIQDSRVRSHLKQVGHNDKERVENPNAHGSSFIGQRRARHERVAYLDYD